MHRCRQVLARSHFVTFGIYPFGIFWGFGPASAGGDLGFQFLRCSPWPSYSGATVPSNKTHRSLERWVVTSSSRSFTPTSTASLANPALVANDDTDLGSNRVNRK